MSNAPHYQPFQQIQTPHAEEMQRRLHGQADPITQRLLGQGDTSPWGREKFWTMEGHSQGLKQVTESRPMRGEYTTESLAKRLLG